MNISCLHQAMSSQIEIRQVSIAGSNLDDVTVRRDARSRGWLYCLASPGLEVTLVSQSAANLAACFSTLMPWKPPLNRAALHFALMRRSTSYRQWLLQTAEIDSGEGTEMLRRRLLSTAEDHKVFVVARVPGVYFGLALGRPREHRLRRSDVELAVRLCGEDDQASSVSKASSHTSKISRSSEASTTNVEPSKKSKPHAKHTSKPCSRHRRGSDTASQITVRCVK